MSIAIVGEAHGEHEERERAPFVGPSGYELTRMLDEAGIRRADCFLTNVFNLRPPSNKIEALCGPKTEALPGYPALVKGKYVRKEFEPELDRLAQELLAHDPNVIICLGNTALWALAGVTAISKIRGTTRLSTHTVAGYKLFPTYHPAAVLRQWELRPITVIDLMKAGREAGWPEIRRIKRQFYLPETPQDVKEFFNEHVTNRVAGDIETAGNAITCIGFAPSRFLSLVIPFVDSKRLGRHYWASKHDEVAVWKIIRDILGNPRILKTFQNGAFDVAFLWRAYGIPVLGAEHDTMLLHHALQPESLKGLGFLGSVYCEDLPAWKDMRTTTIKRDD